MKLNVTDETSTLDTVILGIAEDMGESDRSDPKSAFFLEPDSTSSAADILKEMNALEKVLIENGVKIFRPVNLKDKIQLFVRDVGFVIDDEFFISKIIPARETELSGIEYLIDLFHQQKVIDLSEHIGVKIEGGDVILKGNTVFVGLSERTNHAGFHFLKQKLSDKKKVFQVKLVIGKNDPAENPLHLDCAFQPLGDNHAIIYEDGIENKSELYEVLSIQEENIFKANKQQFINMFPNILSLSKDTVIIETGFIELKSWLLEKGFRTIEVNYTEIRKYKGLLRCSTLPLVRK